MLVMKMMVLRTMMILLLQKKIMTIMMGTRMRMLKSRANDVFDRTCRDSYGPFQSLFGISWQPQAIFVFWNPFWKPNL